MRRLVIIGALAVVGAIALAACGGGAGDTGPSPESPDVAEPSEDTTALPETGVDEEVLQFVGLTLEEASALAERQGRQWRVGRQDGEDLALTADLIDRRVTFEVDDGIVTAATIEHADAEGAAGTTPPEDAGRAELIAEAVEQLVTVDNSFGGGDPFERIEIARNLADDPQRPLGPLALELIAKALEPHGTVVFVDDAEAATQGYFEENTVGVAVVTVDDVRIDGETAEVDVGLWCGSLCGIWVTYEAKLGPDGWEVVGTTGPIAIS
jgi:hypothetical protein